MVEFIRFKRFDSPNFMTVHADSLLSSGLRAAGAPGAREIEL